MPVSDALHQATWLDPFALFERQVILRPTAVAVESRRLTLDYAELSARADRLAAQLASRGVQEGERICILGENDPDFLVLSVAALRLGACVAALNPRLAVPELLHCIRLVTPRVLMVTPRQAPRLAGHGALAAHVMSYGDGTALDQLLAEAGGELAPARATRDPDGTQFIIYTSGTTGLPKGAMISRRAMLARLMVYVLDYGVDGDDTFLAWSPLCHMASIELGFGTLLLGGKVVVLDGADLPEIATRLETERLSNLIFFPGMVEQAIAFLRERRPRVRSLKKFGALADLHTPADIAALTGLLGVPFTNTFGSTETGMPPLSAGRLSPGIVPSDFGKVPSSLCEVRLVDDHGAPVPTGKTGELVMRGPTLFSGYWAAPEATREAFRSGWYHSGDMFRLRADGRYDYVDRRKYLIKSGGENIYPAEIERVVMQHPAIADAVVVRRPDARWGEVPVLVAVPRDEPPAATDLLSLCERELAAFKRPKSVFFLAADKVPRSATGKVVRAEVEAWVGRQGD